MIDGSGSIEVQEELMDLLRMGGSGAVTAFVKNCASIHEAGGADTVSQWIAVALPLLPEAERAALVTLLVDSLLSNCDIEFETYPSTEVH
jgi:hypothetical protein